jgi:hypothetical protein
MTAAAKPGRHWGGGTLDCCTHDLVLMEGGATRAAAVATWALVCTRGDVLVGVAALRRRTTRHFRMRSCLAASVIVLVGVMLLSTLGTDGCAKHGAGDPFVIIRSVSCGHTRRRLHPRNLWHVGCLQPRNSLLVRGS